MTHPNEPTLAGLLVEFVKLNESDDKDKGPKLRALNSQIKRRRLESRATSDTSMTA